jgi:hypothetical protein
MENLTHYPALVFIVAFLSLSLDSAAGAWSRRSSSSMNEEQKGDLSRHRLPRQECFALEDPAFEVGQGCIS